MPKTLTKAQRNRLHDLRMMVFATRDTVYRAAPRDDVPLSECLALCPSAVKARYADALGALAQFEQEMVAQGRGYQAHGLFFPY